MSKLLTAAIAALMIAGGLTAISGASSVPPHNKVVIIGEGSSPLPLTPPCDSVRNNDAGSPIDQ